MNLVKSIVEWSRQFESGELTVEDVQDSFAALSDEDIATLPEKLAKAVVEARRELDAIRYGMCDAGQAGEIRRIFATLEKLLLRR